MGEVLDFGMVLSVRAGGRAGVKRKVIIILFFFHLFSVQLNTPTSLMKFALKSLSKIIYIPTSNSVALEMLNLREQLQRIPCSKEGE